MRKSKSALISLFMLGFVALASPININACKAIPLTPAQLSMDADVIVRATAVSYNKAPEGNRTTGMPDSTVEFRVDEVLKGKNVGNTLVMNGYLDDKDDFNDRAVPYDFVRPGGRAGSCFANSYKKGAMFLLFLKRKEQKLTPYWAALTPTNEQLRSSDDPWLRWVKDFLQSHGEGLKDKPTGSLKELVLAVAGDKGTTIEKTKRLTTWINTSFTWSATDYQKRSVEEIINRRAGNCAELADVLFALLQAGGIRSRWVAEINIQPRNEGRQRSAEKKVAEVGNRSSVFGLRHNDHRWLEVYDSKIDSWFPADPAVGVVGAKEWVAARLKFTNRPTPPVPAVAEITKDMIVPFVVVALESRRGKPIEDRSNHYLVEEFNRFYGGRLSKLPSWTMWEDLIKQLSALGASTFAGETNLHQHAGLIEQLAQVYEKLGSEASSLSFSASDASAKTN